MDLHALTHDERLALVALLEWVLKSDVRTAHQEAERFGRVVSAFGEDAYRALADEVAARFRDDADLRAFLPAVTRQDARALIWGTVLDVAMADAVDTLESEMLDWLAGVWDVRVRYKRDGG